MAVVVSEVLGVQWPGDLLRVHCSAAFVSIVMADARSQQIWTSWVDDSLDVIRHKRLERVLRPLVPTSSPVQVSSTKLAAVRCVSLLWLTGCPLSTYLKRQRALCLLDCIPVAPWQDWR